MTTLTINTTSSESVSSSTENTTLDNILNQPGLTQAVGTLKSAPADQTNELGDTVATVFAALPASGTLDEILGALNTQAEYYQAASDDLQAQFDGIEAPTGRQASAFLGQAADLFKGTIVVGLVALWTMASVMSAAITSTEESQSLTQKLQESMTVAGLDWSTHFSQLLKAQSDMISAEAKSNHSDKAQNIGTMTTEFNRLNSEAQAASTFTSGLSNAVNNSLSSIVQSIQIDMQNIQSSVQKLFDTIAQFT